MPSTVICLVQVVGAGEPLEDEAGPPHREPEHHDPPPPGGCAIGLAAFDFRPRRCIHGFLLMAVGSSGRDRPERSRRATHVAARADS